MPNIYQNQSFQVFSNGEDLILISGDTIYVAKRTYLRNFDINVQHDTIETSVFGNPERLYIPTPFSTDIDLSLIVTKLEYYKSGKIDVNQLLFKNKTILELLKVVKSKVKERDELKLEERRTK